MLNYFTILIEKSLKALLVVYSGNYLKTHELPFLLEKVLPFESRLGKFRSKVEDISGYYIEGRYPILPPETFTRKQASEALSIAQRIYQIVGENMDSHEPDIG